VQIAVQTTHTPPGSADQPTVSEKLPGTVRGLRNPVIRTILFGRAFTRLLPILFSQLILPKVCHLAHYYKVERTQLSKITGMS
jgi:hypothetical protein